MRNEQVIIDKILYQTLKEFGLEEFSVVDVRDRYRSMLDSDIGRNESRKYVYRQVLRLLNKGLLTKNLGNNLQDATYQVTPDFQTTKLKFKMPKHQITIPKKASEHRTTEKFEEQLKQYQIDLLASISESEEYKRIYTSNPELESILRNQYLKARDNSSRLLGQIKALKTVISHLNS